MIPELLPLPSRIQGERVALRPWRRGDGRALFEAIDEDRGHLSRWLPWIAAHQTPVDSEVHVRKSLAWWILRDDLRLAIEGPDHTLLGGTGLHHLDWATRTFEIGYWVRKSVEGKGYATESVALVAALAFERLEASQVKLHCQAVNLRSAAVARRLGFDEQATREVDMYKTDGSLIDLLWFTLSRAAFFEASWSRSALVRVRESDADG